MKKNSFIVLLGLIFSVFLIAGCQDKESEKNENGNEGAGEESASELDQLFFDDEIREYAKSHIGEKATDFTLENILGEKIRLSDYYGEPLILEFADVGCSACQSMQPVLNQFKEESGITVIQVFDYNSKEDVVEFVEHFDIDEKYHENIAHGSEQKSIGQAFNIQYTPTLFYLDAEGVIQLVTVGSDAIENVKKYADFAFEK